jgi:hypothetical protein
VQDAKRDDPHPQNEEHDGQRHRVDEDPDPPEQVLPEEALALQPCARPRVADGQRDAHEEEEGARRGVGEERPEPGGRLNGVAAEVVKVEHKVVDDHHRDGDPARGVHFPESLLVCGAVLRARLLALRVRSGS